VTVPEEFGFRTVTELLGLTDNLPISLQLLLPASPITIAHSGKIAITDFRRPPRRRPVGGIGAVRKVILFPSQSCQQSAVFNDLP
jgi:hypothetical protein